MDMPSHYNGTAATTDSHGSHNHSYSDHSHHLYSGLASSHAPQGLTTQDSSSLVMLPRPAQLPAPAPYSTFNNTFDYGQQPAIQSSWPATYNRPAWNDAAGNYGFSSRPTAHYGDGEEPTAVPHPLSNPSLPRPPASNRATHDVPDPSEYTLRPIAQLHEPPLSLEISAPKVPQLIPSAIPSTIPNAMPVSRALSYPMQQMSALRIHPPQMIPAQTSYGWGSTPIVEMPPPPMRNQDPSPAYLPMPPDMAAGGSSELSIGSWTTPTNTGSASTSPVYDRPYHDCDGCTPLGLSNHNLHPSQLHSLPPIPIVHDVRSVTGPRRGRIATGKQKVLTIASSMIPRQSKAKVSKRGGQLNEDKRKNANTMRKTPNCVRCRFYKSGCTPGPDPCTRCSCIILGKARSFLEPCSRVHIEMLDIVRKCNGKFVQRQADFLPYTWVNGSNLSEMDIMWNLPGHGPISRGNPIRIIYRKYYPEAADIDTTVSVWTSTGGRQEVKQAPYAAYDTKRLQADVEMFFKENSGPIEGYVMQRIRENELAHLTYQEIWRLRQKPNGGALLDLAIKLQCLSVMSQGYGTVWSKDIPGIHEYDFAKAGISGYDAYDRGSRDQPLPAAITHQIDVVILKFLKKLEKECEAALANRIFNTKIKPWYELFLALFILLFNIGYIERGAEKYMMSKRNTEKEIEIRRVLNDQIRRWKEASGVLLQHWRIALRKFTPFKLARENPEELRQKGGLDTYGFRYIMNVVEILDRPGQDRTPRVYSDLSPFGQEFQENRWLQQLFHDADE
ncbi:hypothetical protein P154DRAFT_560177 [Amniculicola lignicola CBS 123094]|uniref:Zn(2)-C6 fungal-type domain-containing protein n=1 Tax=Amniculicola lignicola CBS 123094 TaxID=1392246 RepID=A0A6A5WUJ8_9PLEO|nr:hypothetical protein P154DRAFT_560177 [Amniculicola lignicola CBS 123094]